MTEQCENPLRAFAKLGESFNYLGITMVVVAFYEELARPNRSTLPHHMGVEYVDAQGCIMEKTFYEHHLHALYAQNAAKHLMS